MATQIIALKKPTGEMLISPGIVTIMDGSGFDTVTARYINQGSAESIGENNLPGNAVTCPVGKGKMVFMGLSDTADLPGNCCEYTKTWRGLLVTMNNRDRQVTHTRSIRERNYESITGVVGTGAVKARIMELQTGASVRIVTTTQPSPPRTTGALDSNETIGFPTVQNQYKVTGAPLTYVYPNGWLCYSWQSEEPLPGIWFVSAEYKYEFPTQSG